ncbi:hypothetical protein ACHWQZ_G016606 [Mnemiopsis leidyi]
MRNRNHQEKISLRTSSILSFLWMVTSAIEHDWTEVIRNVHINYDPINTPLRIKTSTELATEGEIRVKFFTVNNQHNAGVNIKIAATPQYWIHYCMANFLNFPTATTLPLSKEKVWVITITRTSEIHLVVRCNGQEILNLQLSGSVCWSRPGDWSTLWNKNFDKISFSDADTASDFYFPFPPGILPHPHGYLETPDAVMPLQSNVLPNPSPLSPTRLRAELQHKSCKSIPRLYTVPGTGSPNIVEGWYYGYNSLLSSSKPIIWSGAGRRSPLRSMPNYQFSDSML